MVRDDLSISTEGRPEIRALAAHLDSRNGFRQSALGILGPSCLVQAASSGGRQTALANTEATAAQSRTE